MARWLPVGRHWTSEAELKHGRLAMLAALAFAVLEITTKADARVDRGGPGVSQGSQGGAGRHG